MAITVVLVVLGILFAWVVADIIIFPTTKGTPIAVVRAPIKLKTAIRMYLRLNLVSVLSWTVGRVFKSSTLVFNSGYCYEWIIR